VVEAAGIEPASFGTEPGLLRAQTVYVFSSRRRHGTPTTDQVTVRCPLRLRDRAASWASCRRQHPGRRHSGADGYRPRSGSERV